MGISEVLLRSIKTEYAYVLWTVALFLLFTYLPIFFLDKDDSHKNDWSSLGFWIIIVYARLIIIGVTGFLSGVVNPIRIVVKYHQEFSSVTPLMLRVGLYALTLLPIALYAAFIAFAVFGTKISNYFFNKEYNTGEGVYEVAPENYKPVREFCDELMTRRLFFGEGDEAFLRRLNTPFVGSYNKNLQKYFYSKGTIMPLLKNEFYDSVQDAIILEPDSEEKYPAYIYNAILTLPGEGERLRYAPFARYTRHDYIQGKVPFFEDYYIECKILYVDGKLYAIIGVGESFNVRKGIENSDTPYEKPYYVVLSETENITTYYDGKFYPHGAIENLGDFEMRPNTKEFHTGAPFRPINYPVRVVERLDLETINAIAAEFQEGILKDTIKFHFEQNKSKTEGGSHG